MGSADARAGEQGAGMMLALHAAFRRDLGHLARAAEGLTRRPERRAAVVRGWVAFRDELHHHHTVEDTSLWPAVRRRTSACADAEVLEAMEWEHGIVDPLVEVVDASLSAPAGAGPLDGSDLAAAVDELHQQLSHHLRHEEQDALPLALRVLTAEDWHANSATARKTKGLRTIPAFLPWLTDGRTAEESASTLALFPGPLLALNGRFFEPRYRRQDRWL